MQLPRNSLTQSIVAALLAATAYSVLVVWAFLLASAETQQAIDRAYWLRLLAVPASLAVAAVMVHDFGELARAARLAQVEADRVALSAAMDLDWAFFRRTNDLQQVRLRSTGEMPPVRSVSGVAIHCSWVVTGDKLQQVQATCRATPPTRFLAILGWSGATVMARSEAIFLYGINEPLNDRLP